MKMKCAHCGKTVGSKSNFCEFCGESTYKQRSMRNTFTLLIVFVGVTAAVFTAITILWRNYLTPMQLPLYKIRKALIEYVREEHPNSEIVKEHIRYGQTGFAIIFEVYPDCHIICEENGFQYEVRYGHRSKTIIDEYKKEKLTNDVRVYIDEEFFKPRGIENVDVRCDYHFNSPSELPNEWSEYDDSYTVNFHIFDQGSTPQEVGWMYEFYKFWKRNSDFPPEWYLSFNICSKSADEYVGAFTGAFTGDYDGNLYVTYKSTFNNEADMYKYYNSR